jgi:uncharacterized membrane protein (DUF373 family)
MEMMKDLLGKFERVVVMALLVMITIVVFLTTVELAYILFKDIVTPPAIILEIDEILDLFGLFLLVLIGVELMETIKTYFHEQIIRVQVVFLVALMAISRKVIILGVNNLKGDILLGIAAVIFALSAGYFFVKLGQGRMGSEKKDPILSTSISDEG